MSSSSGFNLVCCLFHCAAEKAQNHQGDKERERRVWKRKRQRQRKGERQSQEMTTRGKPRLPPQTKLVTALMRHLCSTEQ